MINYSPEEVTAMKAKVQHIVEQEVAAIEEEISKDRNKGFVRYLRKALGPFMKWSKEKIEFTNEDFERMIFVYHMANTLVPMEARSKINIFSTIDKDGVNHWDLNGFIDSMSNIVQTIFTVALDSIEDCETKENFKFLETMIEALGGKISYFYTAVRKQTKNLGKENKTFPVFHLMPFSEFPKGIDWVQGLEQLKEMNGTIESVISANKNNPPAFFKVTTSMLKRNKQCNCDECGGPLDEND